MSNLNGFVKLHRKMIEWGWYSDCVVKDVFLHILMTATFKQTQYLGYDLVPGQAIIGRKKMAKELGFSEQQIRTALKKLESTKEISIFSTNRFTIATVENWDFYQCDDSKPNQQSTNNQPTINQQITNNQPTDNQQITNNQPHLKNVKNDKNVKKIIINACARDDTDTSVSFSLQGEAGERLEKMREKIKRVNREIANDQ